MKLKIKGRNKFYFAFIELLSIIRTYEKIKLAENKINITPLMLSYLVIIHENPNILEKEIAIILGVSKGTLSYMISNLAKKNLISKKKNKEDKRKWDLELTDGGKKCISINVKIREAISKGIKSVVSSSEIKSILEKINRFKDYIK